MKLQNRVRRLSIVLSFHRRQRYQFLKIWKKARHEREKNLNKNLDKSWRSDQNIRRRLSKSILKQKKRKKKLFTCHKLSPVSNRTNRKSLKILINQIEQNNIMMNIQKLTKKLKTKSYNVRKPVKYLSSKTSIYIDIHATRIINAVSHLTRKIENNILNEQLSRVHHRIALTNFYYVYRVAHVQSHTFLKEFNRHSSQHIHQAQSRNKNKHTKIKKRFIELVFDQSISQDDRKKHSIYVNNWQKTSKFWFELIKRFESKILFFMSKKVINCKQVFYQHF